MNFADYVKNMSDMKDIGKKKAQDVYINWKKPFSIADLADAVKGVCEELTEEAKDPLFMLMGLAVTMGLVDKLFPEEEMKQYVESKEGEK